MFVPCSSCFSSICYFAGFSKILRQQTLSIISFLLCIVLAARFMIVYSSLSTVVSRVNHSYINDTNSYQFGTSTPGLLTTSIKSAMVTSPPRQFANMDNATKITTNTTKAPTVTAKYNIYVGPVGRLGNKMFQFASMFAIAKENNKIPCLHKDFNSLKSLFPHISAKFVNQIPQGVHVLHEKEYAVYSPDLTKGLPPGDIRVATYLQSWKYFDRFAQELQQELVISPPLVNKMTTYLSNVRDRWRVRQTNSGSQVRGEDVVFVGIHVRRGDMLASSNVRRGKM